MSKTIFAHQSAGFFGRARDAGVRARVESRIRYRASARSLQLVCHNDRFRGMMRAAA